MTSFSSQPLLQRAATVCIVALAAGVLAGCMSNNAPKPIPPRTGNETIVAADTEGNITKSGTIAANKSIPVLVNDVPVTSYEISQRTKLMRLGGGKGGEKAAIEELIDETLQLIEAQRRGLVVPDAQVDFAYASIGERLKMKPAQFTQALGSQGIVPDTLKKRLRAQIAWQQLVQQRTQQKATIKSQDVTEALLEKTSQNALKVTELTLQQIVFVVPSGSSPNAYAQRRREASTFSQRFAGCDQSLAQAKQLRGVVVKNIGRRESTQLQGPTGDAIKKTPPGKTAPPNQTDQGIELIAVCASREITSSDAARTEVTNDLYLKQAEGLGKDYLAELRGRAIIEYR